MVFFPALANLAKPNVLAIALAFSSGIMLYISLVDIWGKSVDGYASNGIEDGDAVIYGTLSFFGGCALMLVLDFIVDKLLSMDESSDVVVHGPQDGAEIEKMREDFEKKVAEDLGESEDKAGDVEDKTTDSIVVKDTKELKHMSWAMAAAIAIHNFPEGMVTYLGYTQDPSVGIALAVGIAIHNIPEGLCVAMPLYYATGRRWYAFMWGTLSGLTEPFGALLVWVILSNGMSGTVDGVLFGLVAGMMTVITIDELLPTAHKYTSEPKQVTYFCIFGMFFIASSLMLFNV